MPRRADGRAFTLVELLFVIAIIGLLASLLAPTYRGVQLRGEAASCLAKLRQIGVTVNLYATDHDDTLPRIESDPTQPIYQPGDNAKPMLTVLQPYGMTQAGLQCPADLKLHNYAAAEGSSYIWRPIFDDEAKSSLLMYGRRGSFTVPIARARIAMDWDGAPPLGHFNNLFLDGHIKTTLPQ